MLTGAFRNNKRLRGEMPVSSHINVLSHYDDVTLIDRHDRLIRIIKIGGIDSVTTDEQMLDVYKQRRNTLLKSFSSEFGLYFWEIKSKTNIYPEGEFSDGYADQLNQRYKDVIKQSSLFHREHYVAIVTKQPEGLFNKSFDFIKSLFRRVDKAERHRYLAERHKQLNDVSQRVVSALSDYHPERLGVYVKNAVRYSALLGFTASLINGDDHAVPLDIHDAATVLPRKRLAFHAKAGVIETIAGDGQRRFSAVLAIKGYQPFTWQGMFDALAKLDIEYVLTQSYRPFDSYQTKVKMRDQQKDMMQSRDESVTQADQIDEAFDQVASGDVGNGLHHFTLVCHAPSVALLNKHVGSIQSCLTNLDIASVRETVGAECSFWSQLPANFGYILRSSVISTRNMAAFASFHNVSRGKLVGNHWGDAVTVLETIDGSPYYFNFHYKDVGNFLVFGAMGSGKTVLVGFLIAQSMKFGGKRVIFDKDRGLEILVCALGGTYETIKPGVHTGFNPCQLPDTKENRQFLYQLLRNLLTTNGESLTAQDADVINHAIEGMYRLEPDLRQFCHMSSFFGVKRPGSLRERFDQWHGDGAYAWLFDNEKDSLNLDADVIGFDLGHILGDAHCKTPALMYLTYRVEQALEGGRGVLFCDEGWFAMNDPFFQALFNNWSRTPRKKDNIFGLATQVANDTANSLISKSLNESAFTKFFFPNPSADRHVYIDAFGLSEHEYCYIKKMPDDQHYFLLSHGRGVNRQSVVARLNMAKMQDDIAVISARESSLLIFDQVRAEFGKQRDKWLPHFRERCREVA